MSNEFEETFSRILDYSLAKKNKTKSKYKPLIKSAMKSRIIEILKNNKFPMLARQIANQLDILDTSIYCYLNELKKEGHLTSAGKIQAANRKPAILWTLKTRE